MKAIGGYFELELASKEDYHSEAIKLNSGRAAFEYLLRIRKYKKIYMPYYTCDTIFEPIQRLRLEHEFYTIDAKMEPIFDFGKIKEDHAFLYTNYFGLKDAYIQKLTQEQNRLIIDNVPAFFSDPLPGVDCFYSPRKFFGVPDGGYLYPGKAEYRRLRLTRDSSFARSQHLLRRIDVSPEDGYRDFIASNDDLCFVSPKKMSKLTERILRSIDYDEVKLIRQRNFSYLHKCLSQINELDLSKVDFHDAAPIVYPLLTAHGKDLRDALIKERIFVAQYWPNVLEWTDEDSVEYMLTKNLLALPIDQRYAVADMKRVLSFINTYMESK